MDSSPGVRAWLERSAGAGVLYLTTTGRRTGRAHRIEIWFAVHDGRIYLLSGGRDRSDWVRNIRANPWVTVELGGETRRGMARLLEEGTAEDRRARSLLVAKYQSPEDDLSDWGRRSLAVVVEFPDDASGLGER